jgi:hypothetical protein
MSWQIELPTMVRILINDFGEEQQYSDDRLLQVITVAAKYVQFDVSLDIVYAINVSNLSISPDPVDNKDELFTGLVALKAACFIDQSAIRTKAAMDGVRAALGPASLSVGGGMEGLKVLLANGPCASYDELTAHWDLAQATVAKAVLSPFVGNNFTPDMLRSNYNTMREFF